ncbi:MAG: hypothetical protein MAG451_00853 [Anaerolineales bacterium]|nr:hypothetical protein [Anaerolineales bacterium]
MWSLLFTSPKASSTTCSQSAWLRATPTPALVRHTRAPYWLSPSWPTYNCPLCTVTSKPSSLEYGGLWFDGSSNPNAPSFTCAHGFASPAYVPAGSEAISADVVCVSPSPPGEALTDPARKSNPTRILLTVMILANLVCVTVTDLLGPQRQKREVSSIGRAASRLRLRIQ